MLTSLLCCSCCQHHLHLLHPFRPRHPCSFRCRNHLRSCSNRHRYHFRLRTTHLTPTHNKVKHTTHTRSTQSAQSNTHNEQHETDLGCLRCLVCDGGAS